ncbi:MAG: hypothetical protein ACI8RZ_002392 [Myxococcota bacterium]|jgi:hypothetical protein
MSEKTDNALKEARTALRKILASKGRLQGNFYYVGTTTGSEAALVVTLTARDPKGAKAVAGGKELRQELKGAKYARGTVLAEGSKLYFSPSAGTATKDHMKLGFKKKLGDEKGFNFIKKALFRSGDETTSSAPETATTESADTSDIDLSELFDDGMTLAQRAAEEAAVEVLVREQTRLGNLNDQLTSFLSTAEPSRDLGQDIAQHLDRISELELDPSKAAELEKERRLLAQSLYSGDDPFPETGEVVSPEIRQILALSMNKATESLGLFLNETAEKIRTLHSTVSTEDEAWREEQATLLLKELGEYREAIHSYSDQLQKTFLPRRAVG